MVEFNEGGGRPQMGTRRTPVRLRSAEEQAQHRAQSEAARAQQKPETQKVASGESQERRKEEEIQDEWEARRQELVARGDIFDAKGNVTAAGQKALIGFGWSMQHVLKMENLQRNHTSPVEVIRSAEPVRAESRATPSRSPEALRLAAEARARAEKELQERTKQDAERRNAVLGRQQAGVKAYMSAIRDNRSDADAERAKQEAEQAFDRQYQQSRERSAA